MTVFPQATHPADGGEPEWQLGNDSWAPIIALIGSLDLPATIVEAFQFSTGVQVTADHAETLSAALRRALERNPAPFLSLAHDSLFGDDPRTPFTPGSDLMAWRVQAERDKSAFTVSREVVEDLIVFLQASGGVTVG